MSISNNPIASSTSFILDMGKDSATGNQVQKVVLAEPAGGTFIAAAQDGTDATGVTPPAGAVGIRGWLSSIWNTQGSQADAAWSGSGSSTIVAVLKAIYTKDAGTAVAPVRSAALESSHVFKGSAGTLVDSYCLATSTGFYMLFDATLAPVDGAVTPLAVVPVGAGQAVSLDCPSNFPIPFATGLVGVFSTTGPFTKTASATAFMSARVI